MSIIRKPAVANQFYDGDPRRLKTIVSQLIGPIKAVRPVKAVIAPHAGYVYSGSVAGAAYARVEVPETVVILGPNHTGLGSYAAVMAQGAWNMPLGEVPIANELALEIMSRSNYLEEDIQAHIFEHSLEVQVPFLQVRQPGLSIVPICLGPISYEACEDIGNAIAGAISSYERPVLMVASTDMTHYESHTQAEMKDKMAIEQILALNPRGLYDVVRGYSISMCGVIPTTTTLIAAKSLGATGADLVRYGTSGDVSGDYQQVVGYASIVVD